MTETNEGRVAEAVNSEKAMIPPDCKGIGRVRGFWCFLRGLDPWRYVLSMNKDLFFQVWRPMRGAAPFQMN